MPRRKEGGGGFRYHRPAPSLLEKDKWGNWVVNAVLKRCEWAHDDYSLQVRNLPKAPPKAGQQKMKL